MGAKESELFLILVATELAEYVSHTINAANYQSPHSNGRTCEKDSFCIHTS